MEAIAREMVPGTGGLEGSQSTREKLVPMGSAEARSRQGAEDGGGGQHPMETLSIGAWG